MKNSIKRAQSQARLSFAERENFRPKVKQLKKTLLTIVALLAVTGAWADGTVTVTEIKASDIQTWANDGTVVSTADLPGFNTATEDAAKAWTGVPSSGTTLLLYEYDTNQSTWKYIYFEDGGSGTAYTYTFTRDDIMGHLFDGHKVYYTGSAASSGSEVAWNKTAKTGSFTMPGGNVTLEPEYYPQATAAEGAVTAADADARATTDDPLVKVDATKLTGAKKLMYFVSNSGTTAPAYDAEGWTDVLPTAENYTEAANLNVWYYPVGTEEGVDEATATYSDGDICATALTVSLGAAPTYAVTFADDLTEPTLWTASPNTGVTKGQTVTVTYTGTKKVIGVKAEKKAAAAPSVSFTVKRVGGSDPNYADGTYTVAPGTTWQQFIESGDAPACLSIGTSGMYSGKVCHDMNYSLQDCGGTIIANVADKKRVKASDAIIDGATYGCSDYLGYQDHD